MRTFAVWTLDVWGHGSNHDNWGCDGNCDGWTVNNRMRDGTIDLDESGSTESIVKALVDGGFLTGKCLAPHYMKIDGDDLLMFVDRASDDFPVLQLEAI